MKKWNWRKKERKSGKAFSFAFETISEEGPEKAWRQQVREAIDACEREGQDTRTLKFRRVNDSDYDLEINELDYDMEIEYLDTEIRYADIGQEGQGTV